MIGVNEMTIINWEKGRKKPDEKNLKRVKAILGFEPPTYLEFYFTTDFRPD